MTRRLAVLRKDPKCAEHGRMLDGKGPLATMTSSVSSHPIVSIGPPMPGRKHVRNWAFAIPIDLLIVTAITSSFLTASRSLATS
jgi:hypothetical protein